MSCFYFCFFLLIFVFKVLGSPEINLVAHGQALTRRGSTSQITQGLSGFQCTYKRENGRLHPHGETCHHFALFPYLHPGNKVKPENVTPIEFNAIGSIMEIPVELVFFALFHDHPFVAQECCELYGFVVPQFYSLTSVALFQPFKVAVIAADIAVFKCGV